MFVGVEKNGAPAEGGVYISAILSGGKLVSQSSAGHRYGTRYHPMHSRDVSRVL